MFRSLAIALLLLGSFTSLGRAAPAAQNLGSDLPALQAEARRAEQAVAPLYHRRLTLEAEAGRLADTIERLRRTPAGVRRDLELQTALAQSKNKTDELERVQTELRWREPGLTTLRRRMVRLIDSLLDAGGTNANRFQLEQLRSATIAVLVSPALPLQIVRERDGGNNVADPLDGPRELRAKADLLRDSGDKLRRESQRIAKHLDGIERRKHLRERAGALDEDLFGEMQSNRVASRAQGTTVATAGGSRGTASSDSSKTTGGPTAAPNANGSTPNQAGAGAVGNPVADGSHETATGTTTTVSPPSRTSESTVLRNLVDPATLDELRQADAIDDSERQARALKKAQSELESLAKELERRAKVLDGRAEEIKRQK